MINQFMRLQYEPAWVQDEPSNVDVFLIDNHSPPSLDSPPLLAGAEAGGQALLRRNARARAALGACPPPLPDGASHPGLENWNPRRETEIKT